MANYSVNQQGQLVVKCSECEKEIVEHKEDIYMDFEVDSTNDRSMSVEKIHSAIIPIQCDCGNEVQVTISVCEYPEGCHSEENDSIDVDFGELVSCFSLELPKY